MTTPSSGAITLGHVMDELRVQNPGRAYPISLGDADVRALAGVPSGPISLSNLYGKSSISPLQATGNNDYAYSSSAGSGGIVIAHPSVNSAGGSGVKRFAWSILSASSAVALGNADQPQCSVSKSFVKTSSGYIAVYLRCVVSDDTGSVTVDNILAELEWESAA